MGKSTLAQLVYSDGKIAKDFKYRFWACISDILDEHELIGKICQSMTDQEQYDRLSLNQLQERVRKFITGLKGRFILVLDDLWDEDHARGSGLWSLLSSDVTKGSKIIVTTRNSSVAEAYKADKTLFLKGLSSKASWELFKIFAFSEKQESDPTWISLGKKIVEKCVNLPLPIKTIACLLRIKTTMEEWKSLEDEELSKIATSENPITSALRLSYDHLPSHLKNCFAYCSLFPKDSRLDKQHLIYLWIAQGYVKPKLNETLAVTAHACFMELARRSFFEEEAKPKPKPFIYLLPKESNSGIRRYKMHDLVHDLAQNVSRDETLILTTTAHEINKRVRHLSVASEMDDTWRIAPPLVEVDRLRSSFFISKVARSSRVLDQQVTKLRFLHSLDFRWQEIFKVPCSIGKLKYLRYLNLSENRFSRLPDALTKLVNLLTLDISKCRRLRELPENIGELMNLRHLVNNDCDQLWQLPPSLGELTSLEHLSEYKVTKSCDNVDTSVLARLNLRGKLEISIHDREGGLGEEETLESMHIPNTIEELVIRCFSGMMMRIPTWWREDPASRMSKLECLELFGSVGVKRLPPLRRLPYLRVLSLSNFSELEYMEEEGGGNEAGSTLFFPCLVKLELFNMPKLRGWFRRLNEEKHTLLSELRIEWCDELVRMPLAPRLRLLFLARTTAKLVSLLLPTCSLLTSLTLGGIKGQLTSFRCKGLNSLRKVHLIDLEDLRDVRLAPKLVEELTIYDCRNLNLWEDTEEDGEYREIGVDWASFTNLRLLTLNPIRVS